MKIQVLGVGCSNCNLLFKNVKEAVKEASVNAEVEEITDIKEIMKFDIINMPGLVINGKVVSAGKVLSKAEIINKIMTVKSEE